MESAFLATNLITSGATITPSTEDESYPAEYLYDFQAARVFRCTSTSTLTILIDFAGSINADTIALINHNLSSSAVLDLKAGSVNPPTVSVATPTYRQYDLWKAFTLTSARYWLLTITDANSAALQIGQLIIGKRVAFPRARRIASGYKPSRMRDMIGGETYAGVIWQWYLFQRNEFNPSYRVKGEAELAIFTGLDAALYGSLYPFLYIPDTSAAACYFVRKESSFEPSELDRIGGGDIAYDIALKLVEESRGLDILE